MGGSSRPTALRVVGSSTRSRSLWEEADPHGALAGDLPLLDPLATLLGRGLKRGALVAVSGAVARMSLAMTLMAKVSAEGGWCGVVGVPSFGYLAASELGIRLDQLALVPAPGGVWSEATAALLTGLDLVVVQPPGPVSGALARRLAARARRYRCTLVTLGSVWEGTDVRVAAIDQAWEGLHTGWGRLSARKIRIVASTRLGQNIEMWLPAADGGIRLADVGLQTSDVSAGEPESSRVVASSLSASAS